MKTSKPVISVIIPVFNGERYLAAAIESVKAQSYRPLDIVVLDDGSTDDSAVIARQYMPSITYCYQPNEGLASALNKAISLSKGEYFSFLDADDLWLPEKLDLQMKVFEADPAMDMIFGHMRQFFSPDIDETIKAKIIITDKMMPSYFKGSILIKRESFFRVGLFDAKWKLGDFVDWYLKALEKGLKSYLLPDLVMERRVHDRNMVMTQKKFQADYLRILKASLDRRRGKNL